MGIGNLIHIMFFNFWCEIVFMYNSVVKEVDRVFRLDVYCIIVNLIMGDLLLFIV